MAPTGESLPFTWSVHMGGQQL
uniref:Uncharacterized protein n=1 Tax=Arundo donax TaxID=35708 RepID=A0A0A9HJA6_ARUDO